MKVKKATLLAKLVQLSSRVACKKNCATNLSSFQRLPIRLDLQMQGC